MEKVLNSHSRRALRAQAHALKPVVMISEHGLTPGVLNEIERGLVCHGLIKIRVTGLERDDRDRLLIQVCSKTGSHAVQHIGKILVIYREPPESKSGTVGTVPPHPVRGRRIIAARVKLTSNSRS